MQQIGYMNETEIQVRLAYISGLRPVVMRELKHFNLRALGEIEDSVFIKFSQIRLPEIKRLSSIARAYVVLRSDKYNPTYIANRKSILGDLIDAVLKNDAKLFKSFKITCAGSGSSEVKKISKHIQQTYGMSQSEEADLKIHIVKVDEVWEVGVQITPRPLSVRDYRVVNMNGAMDPTIAFAVNSFCDLEARDSYLNIFSGSGTLLIEAGQCYPNLKKLVGFDIEKKHISLSIQNIKKAGLITRVQVKEADIFDKPDFGKFDAIASDLPFGMAISKGTDLRSLYQAFVAYCEERLNPKGRLVIYTSEFELAESILSKSRFDIIQSWQLKFMTNADMYLKTKIIVCEFKAE